MLCLHSNSMTVTKEMTISWINIYINSKEIFLRKILKNIRVQNKWSERERAVMKIENYEKYK